MAGAVGLAAIGDEAVTEEFADMAPGVRGRGHPRGAASYGRPWPPRPRQGRVIGTFGEDAELSARMTAAYIRGFQGTTLGPASVACMTKHFPGGGPQKDGEDPTSVTARSRSTRRPFRLSPAAFEAASPAGHGPIMPYYGQPIGTDYEEVLRLQQAASSRIRCVPTTASTGWSAPTGA
ncbi:MAG: glycoside hydrolase family 3 N-terminal domain-containing protein [Caldilineaceae bacterium]